MIQIENITLLNKNNLAGENKLEVLKNYGLQCELTDLAIITGAIDRDIFYNLDTPYQLTSEFSPKITIIDNHGNLKETTNNVLPNGIIRPVIKLKEEVPFYLNDGIPETIYGVIPQFSASTFLTKSLENALNQGTIEKTAKNYYLFTDKKNSNKLIPTPEYIYKGKKYIRVSTYKNHILSKGKIYKYGNPIWLKVSPIVWLYDQKTNTLISKLGLLSGINYSNDKTKNFETSNIYNLLNHFNTFIKEDTTPHFSLNSLTDQINNQDLKRASLNDLKTNRQNLKLLKHALDLELQITDEEIKQKTLKLH